MLWLWYGRRLHILKRAFIQYMNHFKAHQRFWLFILKSWRYKVIHVFVFKIGIPLISSIWVGVKYNINMSSAALTTWVVSLTKNTVPSASCLVSLVNTSSVHLSVYAHFSLSFRPCDTWTLGKILCLMAWCCCREAASSASGCTELWLPRVAPSAEGLLWIRQHTHLLYLCGLKAQLFNASLFKYNPINGRD